MIKKLCLVTVLALGTSVQALPLLQLDATGDNVAYDMATQSVIVTGTSSTVYALVDMNNKLAHLDEYYLAVALISGDGPVGGSFTIGSLTINTADMMPAGVPPSKAGYEDLQTHGVYPAPYYLLSIDPGDFGAGAKAYNVQDDPGAFSFDASGQLEYLAISIDASDLQAAGLHFDLFGYDEDWTAGNAKKGTEYMKIVKAPFSHDLILRVPDGGTTLALLGLGLLGLGAANRRFKR